MVLVFYLRASAPGQCGLPETFTDLLHMTQTDNVGTSKGIRYGSPLFDSS